VRARLLGLTRTLHFRLTTLFLLLACASIAAYYYLLPYTVFSTYDNEAEEAWYRDRADAEVDSLANHMARFLSAPGRAESLLVDYGRRVHKYDAEFMVFDAGGRHLWSSAPDSLGFAVPACDPALLLDMSDGEWDFQSYPDSTDISAYSNRIMRVSRIVPDAGDDEHPPAFLATSFMDPAYAPMEAGDDRRALVVQGLIMLLVYAAASALIIMAWTSRRISRLSRGVQVFTDGDLSARVPESRSDEIGVLGHNINDMAVRIASMMEDMRGKEQFQRQLVANISHDLRTPLAGLRGYLETLGLQADRLGPEDRRRFMENITQKLDHLDRLIDHALVLSRLDSGQDTFRHEDFSLGELASTVLARFELVAEGRGVGLELDLEDNLPDVHADPLQIGRVLQNLVENGIKFTPAGGTVTLRAWRDDKWVEVSVTDDGVGIAPEDLPHIFERFYTGDKSRTPACDTTNGAAAVLDRSSGLGLAIASRIVETHGGVLGVESAPEQGSTFRFQILAATTVDRAAG
jgi:signal transduction histidine kinase